MAYLSGPLAEIGITRGKIAFLMEVLRQDGVIQEDLTRSLCIDRAATARALQDLEKEGLIRREEDPQDRRRKRVYSTTKTKALQHSLVAILESQQEALFTGLNDNERVQFLGMLDRLVENMRDAVSQKKS